MERVIEIVFGLAMGIIVSAQMDLLLGLEMTFLHYVVICLAIVVNNAVRTLIQV